MDSLIGCRIFLSVFPTRKSCVWQRVLVSSVCVFVCVLCVVLCVFCLLCVCQSFLCCTFRLLVLAIPTAHNCCLNSDYRMKVLMYTNLMIKLLPLPNRIAAQKCCHYIDLLPCSDNRMRFSSAFLTTMLFFPTLSCLCLCLLRWIARVM